MQRFKFQLTILQILLLTVGIAIATAMVVFRRTAKVPITVRMPIRISKTQQMFDEDSGEWKQRLITVTEYREAVQQLTVQEVGWPLPYNQSSIRFNHQSNITQFPSDTINWRNLLIDLAIPLAGTVFCFYFLPAHASTTKKSH